MTNNFYIGSFFDNFLVEEGILESCTRFAVNALNLQLIQASEWQESNKMQILQSPDCEREDDFPKSPLKRETCPIIYPKNSSS
jgi:hypothetical protein